MSGFLAIVVVAIAFIPLAVAAIDGDPHPHQLVDFLVAIADFAKDFDAVAAHQRRRPEILPSPGGKPVGKGELDDLALDRVLDLAKEPDVGQMLVCSKAFYGVDSTGGDIGSPARRAILASC